MAEFSFETSIPVRFQDLDVVGHVNNAVYATYLEEARTEYIEDVFGVDPEQSGVVIAHLEIDYRQPVTEDTEVTVALRTREPGTSSIPMDYEIRTADGVAATAETVMVTIDYDTGETQPMPEVWRERLAAFEDW
jgi:acyl-CoA thioester hydrolase